MRATRRYIGLVAKPGTPMKHANKIGQEQVEANLPVGSWMARSAQVPWAQDNA